jgi:hypothetical protein
MSAISSLGIAAADVTGLVEVDADADAAGDDAAQCAAQPTTPATESTCTVMPLVSTPRSATSLR